MRTHAMSLLAAGAILAACSDPSEPGQVVGVGQVVVVTSTTAGASDGTDYEVVVDSLDSHTIAPDDTSQLSVQPGRHTLTLRGIPEHCVVTPGASLAVDVPPDGSVKAQFNVRCAAARITTRTTGTNLDPNGYRLSVNGADVGALGLRDTVLARLEPGTWMLALTDVSSNCAVDGPGPRQVTVVSAEVVLVDFSVVCTATTGRVQISVVPTGPDLSGQSFVATIDDDLRLELTMSLPRFVSMPVGDHVISLQGTEHCAVVGAESKAVTVVGGGTTPDIFPVEFPVTCTVPPEKAGTVRITAEIAGPPPGTPFPVRYTHSDPWGYGGNSIALDSLVPGKAVVVRLEASSADPDHALYWFELGEVPGQCQAGDLGPVEVPLGDTVDIAIPVRCSSPWDY